ncbi:MAG TPA: two-component regulator propeller domain-containing protein, partial [Terriglobales bacterium]|nr:two-component regulator propeller domain-containing protein [Terriglobales bacterium]
MIRRIARLCLWAVLVTACIPRANALDPERLISQYVRERWESDRGLHGEVYAITQSSDGYLWIGTDKGLFRFDGLTFRPMADSGSPSLPIAQVLGLTVDAQGNLLVRLPERNLLRYSEGTFDNILRSLQPRELAITAMAQSLDGAVLVSGLTNGTLRFAGGRFETLVPVSALPASPIISLAQSSDGKVWLGTREAGLFYADHGRVTGLSKGLPSRKINSLLAIGKEVWIGTDAGVVRWNGSEITVDGVPPVLRSAWAISMLKDRQSNLWVGTRAGLLRVNPHGIAELQLDKNPPSVVNVVFEDREGNLWSGGPWGIERLSDNPFATYGRAEGLPSDHIGPVFVDSEGRTWFAPIEGGLYWLDREERGRITEGGLGTGVVYSIAGGKDGLWLGRQKGGLTHLYSQNGRFAVESYTAGLARNSVYSVYQSRDSTVWAGTLSGGVSKLQGGRITTYSREDGLASNTVNSILEDADGTMWFGTADGLSAFANGRWRSYTVNDGLPSNDVNCLEQDAGGVLWIGTSAGLALRSAGEIRTPRQPSEALHGQVFGVVQDPSGWLWVVTSNEVVRVNRDRLLAGVLRDGDLREYGVDDGLRSVGGIKRQRSLVLDPLGRVWASMNSGLAVVDPAQLVDTTPPPMVHILSVSADGNPINPHSVVKV